MLNYRPHQWLKPLRIVFYYVKSFPIMTKLVELFGYPPGILKVFRYRFPIEFHNA